MKQLPFGGGPRSLGDMYELLDRLAYWTARGMALIGGAVLLAVVAMACVSITGRALVSFGLAPISGDFEIVEMGVGFAVFAFLPWCQYMRGHAAVDLLKPAYPRWMNCALDFIVDAAMLALAVLIAWRLWFGMMDKMRYGETTFILQFPMWQAYAAAFVGAVAFVIVAAFCVIRAIVRPETGLSEKA